jgi:hypothetical protein
MGGFPQHPMLCEQIYPSFFDNQSAPDSIYYMSMHLVLVIFLQKELAVIVFSDG